MTTTWPRGAEWRKWDLHIHAPGTKLNDNFNLAQGDVWDEYCRRLEESELFEAIRKTLVMQPHQVEIVPVPKQ